MTESADVGRRAVDAARAEGSNVRLAHALYQLANTYLWAEHLEQATRTQAELHNWAALSASRWIAWDDWIQACLYLRSGRTRAAKDALQRSRDRFAAEGLRDGLVSVDTVRLTWRRVSGEVDGFEDSAAELREMIGRTSVRGRFYARGHPFSLEAVEFELAEYERCHVRQWVAARKRYERLTHSEYPLHQGLGHLGLSRLGADTASRSDARRRAAEIGRAIGCALLLDDTPRSDVSLQRELALQDIVFC